VGVGGWGGVGGGVGWGGGWGGVGCSVCVCVCVCVCVVSRPPVCGFLCPSFHGMIDSPLLFYVRFLNIEFLRMNS
jgi:hypothetical protein